MGNASPFFVDMLALIEEERPPPIWLPIASLGPGRIGIAAGRRAPSRSIPIPPQIRDFALSSTLKT